ncbi:hypothetical protein AGLY_011523 [Aphis glycines]|uniref:HTH psq-type domain-containing protein n=1 Tax=Aphis glycines TaxID=307491 RepID=A0A6G0TBR9_APHGL|nr:hypothetical protein AGLY_011523 [Aphis glycines]
MPRNHKKNFAGRYNLKYTNENLSLAVNAVKRKQLTLRKASEQYGIPRTTLKRKVSGTHTRSYGRQKVLNELEETNLCEGRSEKRFKNNLPGTNFVKHFSKRHPELSEWFGENIKRARANITNEVVNNFFDNLSQSLENVFPCSIINYDETNFTDDPKKQKIITKRGSKHPENILDASKTSISVMMAGNAEGELLPPYIVYKAENLYPTWTENGPQGTRYNRSGSGWFDERIFDD